MPDRNRASPRSADDTRKELEVPPHDGPITLVLATDSFLIGDGLASLLAGVAEVEVVARAHGHEELLALVEELTPEALIVSIRSPIVTTMPTIVAARRLREEFPDMGIVVISDRGDGFALELLRGGRIENRLPTRHTAPRPRRRARRTERGVRRADRPRPGHRGLPGPAPRRARHRRSQPARGRNPGAARQGSLQPGHRRQAARLDQVCREVRLHHLPQARARRPGRRPPSHGRPRLPAGTDRTVRDPGDRGEDRRGDSLPATSHRRYRPCASGWDRTGSAAASRRAAGAGTARAAALPVRSHPDA